MIFLVSLDLFNIFVSFYLQKLIAIALNPDLIKGFTNFTKLIFLNKCNISVICMNYTIPMVS